MIQLLRLEFVKFKRSRYMLILLSLVLILLCGYFFYVDQKEISIEKVIETVQINYDLHKDGYEKAKAEMEAVEGRIGDQLQREFDMYERGYNSATKQSEGINSGNWSLYIQGVIESNSQIEQEKIKELELVAKSYIWPTPFTFLSEMDRLRWMEERNIQPIFPTIYTSWRSVYDEEFTEPVFKEMVTKATDKHSSASFHFTYEIFQYVFSIIGIIFFVFLFGDILTREGFGKNGPIHMLRTQPIRKWQFWLSKGVTVIGGSLFIVIGFALVGILLGAIFNRLGDWNYPILIYGPNRTYSFLPLTVFIGKALGLFLLLLALGFSLLFFFSVLTNRAIIAIGLTVVLLFGGKMLAEQSTLLSWAHMLPFHYFDVYKIVNGEYAVLQNNELYTYSAAILSVSVTVAIVLVVTFVIGKLRKGVIS